METNLEASCTGFIAILHTFGWVSAAPTLAAMPQGRRFVDLDRQNGDSQV